MALRLIQRFRAPLDGTWFKTEANLSSIMQQASPRHDDMKLPHFVDQTRVPIWVSLQPHIGLPSKRNPEATYYHTTIKVGSDSSPEVKNIDCYAAGLYKDPHLDGYDADNKWLYSPIEGSQEFGEDASVYECDRCKHWLYRDDQGRRYDRSACLKDSDLVCRDCDMTGLIYDSDVETHLKKCRKLATHLGEKATASLQRCIDSVGGERSWGQPSQTRLYMERPWSFGFAVTLIKENGDRKQSLSGGIIQHGPAVILKDDGSYEFKQYDYGAQCHRDANEVEVGNISWSTHT